MIGTMFAAAAVLLTGAADPPSPDAPPADWGVAARADLAAFHATVVADHPGPVNRIDPGFSRREARALAVAERRAARVVDYPGYLATLRGYAASFDDGHVALGGLKSFPVALQWPGFLTAYDGAGRQVVRARVDDAPVAIGDELLGCDRRDAAAVARARVGDFYGRWRLAAMRGRHGFRVFVDNRNPFVPRPVRCRFRGAAGARAVTLAWRAFSDEAYGRYAAPLAAAPRPPIGVRVLADGTRWYAMSDFDGDPSGAAAKALLPMIAAMKRDRAAVAAAPAIVLDLRGNGGGSSDWSRQIAAILWGAPAVARLDLDSDGVEWRASAANAASLAAYRDTFAKAPDAEPAVRRYFAAAAAGIAAARAAGRALWREPAGLYVPDTPAAGSAAVDPPAARVLVLTDWGCGSACLDAVDLWKALGAVQVGQETSADTLYMDVRTDPLPSGVSRAVVPMKVYRGRKRGSNVPHVPAFRYPGDMRDTAALERWIAALPRGGEIG